MLVCCSSAAPVVSGQKPVEGGVKDNSPSPVDYRIAYSERSLSENEIVLNISVKPENINRDFLALLARHLNQRFSADRRIAVAIFDDFKAAKNYDIGFPETHDTVRGEYFLDRSTGEEYVSYSVTPNYLKSDPRSRIKIELGTKTSRYGQRQRTISGRVVDAAQRPIARAIVTIYPLSQITSSTENVDGLIALSETGIDGSFRIPSTLPAKQQVLLYVTTPVTPSAYVPLTAPFLDLTGKSLFSGHLFVLGETSETDVGTIPLSVRYGTATVELQDSAAMPLFPQNSNRPPILLRVRNARGDIVSDGTVPSKAICKKTSSITVALPEGVWYVDLAFGSNDASKDAKWHAISDPLNIRAPTDRPRVTLKVPLGNEGDMRSADRGINGDLNPQSARQRLKALGFAYNADSFVERAEKDNLEAVQLFLIAGMNPNAKDRRSNTALMAAAANGHANIIKVLLNAGANVNETSENNETALVAAASFGSPSIVHSLLHKGANPNVRTGKGVTPLIVAAGNDNVQVVEALLAAGADVEAKNNEGMTALDFAMQSENKKLIQLLRKVYSRK